jgi:hypothetical protein
VFPDRIKVTSVKQRHAVPGPRLPQAGGDRVLFGSGLQQARHNMNQMHSMGPRQFASKKPYGHLG